MTELERVYLFILCLFLAHAIIYIIKQYNSKHKQQASSKLRTDLPSALHLFVLKVLLSFSVKMCLVVYM